MPDSGGSLGFAKRILMPKLQVTGHGVNSNKNCLYLIENKTKMRYTNTHILRMGIRGGIVQKILVVEDDLALSSGLCFELDMSGYLTVASYNCWKTKQLLKTEHFDLAILDVNLPDGNGFGLCKEMKQDFPELPVIFLTANDLDQDVLKGFDFGADDYITKPFNVQILKRRVEAVLHRVSVSSKKMEDCYDDGYLRIDFSKLTSFKNNEKLNITPNEYKLLTILRNNARNIVTRQILLEKLWDCDGNYIDDHTLTVNINRLRAKIEDESHTYIKTVRGIGYIWTGEKA